MFSEGGSERAGGELKEKEKEKEREREREEKKPEPPPQAALPPLAADVSLFNAFN